MQINLTGHHVDITTAIREHVTEKMAKLERHFDNITSAHVVLNVEKLRHIAEATVYVCGAELFATAEDENMYSAIDAMIDKLDRQVIRHKEKLKKY